MRVVSLRTFAVAACLFALCAPRSSCLAETLEASRGGGRWVLSATNGAARLELPGGQALSFRLPATAQLSSLAGLDDGWVAAGSLATGDRRRLFLVGGGADAEPPRRLAVPPARGRQQRGAVLLVDPAANGRLAGLAWLEGDDDRSLAVRAAAWDGRQWGAPEEVSSPGPGSQLALSGTVLADGSWLLAWSAFDGEDDEIVWSRRDAGGWLAPKRLAAGNRVPDITPVVATAGEGALAAWSRYDGEGYRLVLARFAGGEWREERFVGPRGSLYPSFGGEPGRASLLYLSALPRGWSLLELDVAGKVLRRTPVVAAPAGAAGERPVASSGTDGEVRLRWPGSSREATARWEKAP